MESELSPAPHHTWNEIQTRCQVQGALRDSLTLSTTPAPTAAPLSAPRAPPSLPHPTTSSFLLTSFALASSVLGCSSPNTPKAAVDFHSVFYSADSRPKCPNCPKTLGLVSRSHPSCNTDHSLKSGSLVIFQLALSPESPGQQSLLFALAPATPARAQALARHHKCLKPCVERTDKKCDFHASPIDSILLPEADISQTSASAPTGYTSQTKHGLK